MAICYQQRRKVNKSTRKFPRATQGAKNQVRLEALLECEAKNPHNKIVLWKDLLAAYEECKHRKTSTDSYLAFKDNETWNLMELYSELNSGGYKPGTSVYFIATQPKYREVWAADFKDRIVHHLLYNIMSPVWEPEFATGSFACRPNKGTLAAINYIHRKLKSHAKRGVFPQYVKYDLSNFFVSINKRILKEILREKVGEYAIYWDLIETVIDHDPTLDYVYNGNPKLQKQVPAHKQLMQAKKGVGLPIGNLTSQFFANVLLNKLDQYVLKNIPNLGYARYVDDFVILIKSRSEVAKITKELTSFLDQLGLQINPSKTKVNDPRCGLDFVGQIIRTNYRLPRTRIVRTAARFIRKQSLRSDCTLEDFKQFGSVVNSFLGILKHSNSYRVRKRLQVLLQAIGVVTNKQITKVVLPKIRKRSRKKRVKYNYYFALKRKTV